MTHLIPGGFQSALGRSIRADTAGFVENDRPTKRALHRGAQTEDGHATWVDMIPQNPARHSMPDERDPGHSPLQKHLVCGQREIWRDVATQLLHFQRQNVHLRVSDSLFCTATVLRNCRKLAKLPLPRAYPQCSSSTGRGMVPTVH